VRLLTIRVIQWGGLLAIVGLLLMGVFLKRRSEAQVALAPPLPQDPQIQAYFNHAESALYSEPYRQQERLGDNLEQVIVAAIQQAQTSIEVAVQELNLPQIALALQERHQAGVKVRVIVENTYRQPMSQWNAQKIRRLNAHNRSKYENFVQFVDQNQDGRLDPTEVASRDAMAILTAANIPLLDDTADGSKGSGLMHHKFVVIDGQTVVMGSANFTWSDLHGDFLAPTSLGNANHLLKIESPAVARLYQQEFDLMWGKGKSPTGKFGLKKPYRAAQRAQISPHSQVTVQFSPTSVRQPWSRSVNGLINQTLAQAHQSIDLALFVFSDQQLSNQLNAEHRQGVQIRALIDPGFAYRDYSEALDLLGIQLADNQCRYRKDNAPWKTPITAVGTPQLPKGDLLHHKFAVIDQQIVVSGSQNWTEAANRNNDENLLVINNATVAAHFEREFERLYSGAVLGLSSALQDRVHQQQIRCRF
jgi:phosphatidylserine/phosphatidylglycerophosphate/cardiolipin synthase-like enzyme